MRNENEKDGFFFYLDGILRGVFFEREVLGRGGFVLSFVFRWKRPLNRTVPCHKRKKTASRT